MNNADPNRSADRQRVSPYNDPRKIFKYELNKHDYKQLVSMPFDAEVLYVGTYLRCVTHIEEENRKKDKICSVQDCKKGIFYTDKCQKHHKQAIRQIQKEQKTAEQLYKEISLSSRE